MVGRQDSVLHPLNIAESGIRTPTRRLSAIGIPNNSGSIDISQSRQIRTFVSNISHIEQEVRSQFTLNPEVELLNIRTALVWVFRTPVYEWREVIRIQQSVRVAVDQLERRGGSDRDRSENIRNNQVVHQKRRIESQHAFPALTDRMVVIDAVGSAK